MRHWLVCQDLLKCHHHIHLPSNVRVISPFGSSSCGRGSSPFNVRRAWVLLLHLLEVRIHGCLWSKITTYSGNNIRFGQCSIWTK